MFTSYADRKNTFQSENNRINKTVVALYLSSSFEHLMNALFFFGSGIVTIPESNKKLVNLYLLLPALCAFVLNSCYSLCFSKRVYEGESLIDLTKGLSGISFYGSLLLISFKLDERLNWNWSQAVFPFWIFFAILITIGLVCVTVIVSVIGPLLTCKSKEWSKLACYFWINLNVFGMLFFMATIHRQVIDILDSKDPQKENTEGLENIIGAAALTAIFLLIYLAIFISPIRY